MERVLEQVAQEWPELLPPGTGEGATRSANQDGEAEEELDPEDVFDPVTLALSLVDPEATQDRFRSFLATKDALSRSLQSSTQPHYRTFDASVSSYNGLLSNISHAQKNASSLRTALEDVREMLGKGRAELGVLEARRTELNEIDKILVAIETLKNVPDKLETLMSEKRFLSAAVLLVRSLKMINKQDLREVPATADLRAYFVSQENVGINHSMSL
jgi:exocyst complex component 4